VPSLLHVQQGTHNFVNAEGQRIWLLGYGGVCCHADNTVNGWPWFSESYLRELAAHGGDFIHLRMGPPSASLEPRPEYRPYLDNGQWNPACFAKLNALLDLAYSLGVYVEIDLIDGWALKDPSNNWWHLGVDIMRTSPKPPQQAFVNKVVAEVGRHPNILWQIGNETGVPTENGPVDPATGKPTQVTIDTLAWELGIVDAVHIQETASGHPRHIMATNAGIGKVDRHGDIDYIETHQCEAPEQPGATPKPVMVNECNGIPGTGESFSNFSKQVGIAESRGTYYQLWISDMPDGQRQQALDFILAYRKRHP